MSDPTQPAVDRQPNVERPLSLIEVAALFGRTPRSIRNWVRAGLLSPLPLPRGPYFAAKEIRVLCERGPRRSTASE